MRNDEHRKSQIRPADYRYLFSFSLPAGDDLVCWNVERYREAVRSGRMFKNHGGMCAACGAWFRHGDVWEHVETGEMIRLGHDCADKYDLVADRSEWNKGLRAARARRAAEVIAEDKRRIAAERAAAAEEFLDAPPGLRDALAADHDILRDMAEKLRRFGSLSEKQTAFALKLADEVRNPRPVVECPEGKQTLRGVIRSVKVVDGFRGDTFKMLVEADAGFRVWGTVPSVLVEAACEHIREHGTSLHAPDSIFEVLRGQRVEITAEVARSDRDPGFGFFKRPRLAGVPALATEE